MNIKQSITRGLMSSFVATALIITPINTYSQVYKKENLEKYVDKVVEKTLSRDIKAFIEIESSWNPDAERYEPQVNDISIGLGQILTTKAKELEAKYSNLPRLGNSIESITRTLKNPTNNIAYASRLFSDLMNVYQTPELAVAAYNAGERAPKMARCQQQLNSIMKTDLKTDGVNGTETRKVVMEFQKKYDLTSDGIIGRETYAKINLLWNQNNPGRDNPVGIIPMNNITPYHVKKFKAALAKY